MSLKELTNFMIMKIRNPFKDNFLRWKDDASNKEKFIWSMIIASIGIFTYNLFLGNEKN